MTHELKCWPDFFSAILRGDKTFELRKDDRGFRAGHSLRLREWLPTDKTYTGREIKCDVTYVMSGPPLMPSYVCMGFRDFIATEKNP